MNCHLAGTIMQLRRVTYGTTGTVPYRTERFGVSDIGKPRQNMYCKCCGQTDTQHARWCPLPNFLWHYFLHHVRFSISSTLSYVRCGSSTRRVNILPTVVYHMQVRTQQQDWTQRPGWFSDKVAMATAFLSSLSFSLTANPTSRQRLNWKPTTCTRRCQRLKKCRRL